jgi:hypothetical protein
LSRSLVRSILLRNTIMSALSTLMYALLVSLVMLLVYGIYELLIAPRNNPLRQLAGPPIRGILGNHMDMVLR